MKRIIAAALAIVLGCCGWTPTRQAIPVSREMTETKPCVALTFDDGPSRHTARLLDGLQERGVQAPSSYWAASWKETRSWCGGCGRRGTRSAAIPTITRC